MYYHPFQTTVFENVDKIIEKELMIPSQMHTKNLGILRSLELFKCSTLRTIVNTQ